MLHAEVTLEDLWRMTVGGLDTQASPPDGRAQLILRQRLEAGSEPDWTSASVHLETAGALRSEGKNVEAVEEVALAFAHTSPALDHLVHAVGAMLSAHAFDAAELWARRMMDNGADSAAVELHLALAVWNSGRFGEALRICDVLVERFPEDVGGVSTAATLYLAKDEAVKALQACLGLLERREDAASLTAPFCDLLTRAAVGSGIDLPAWCSTRLDKACEELGALPELSLAREVLGLRSAAAKSWPHLFSDATQDETHEAMRLRGASRTVLQQLFSASPAPRIMSLYDEDSLAGVYGGAVTRPDALEAEGFQFPGTARAEHPPLSRGATPRFRDHDPVRRLQLTTLAEGLVTLLSPFGDTVQSASSFVVYYHPEARQNGCVLCYYFASPRPLFAIFASEAIWPVAWYDPLSEIVLLHGQMVDFEDYLRHIVRELRFVLLCDPPAARAYMRKDSRRQGKRTTLLFGVLDYVSSHALDLQGLKRTVDGGVHERLHQIVVTAPEPLGPIEDYFAEISPSLIQRPCFRDVTELNSYLWSENSLCMRVTGGYVEPSMAGRMRERARAKAEPIWREALEILADERLPILFLSLRTTSRRWLVQPDEIAGMFNRLAASYPRLALVFDGYAALGGSAPEAALAADLRLIEAIREQLSPDISVLVAAGRSMEDTIYAAASADLHLSAQGTNGIKAVVIAGKPGVVIGSRQFTFDIGGLRHPRPALITLGEEARDAAERNSQCDYWLDPALVEAALRSMIEQACPGRERRQADD